MILIDYRSGSSELSPLIRIPHHITKLEYGDFSFMGNGPQGPAVIGVERKTIMDLVSSISSGRLSGHQLVGLLNIYDFVYVVVEGQWKIHPSGLLYRVTSGGNWTKVHLGKREFSANSVYNFINTMSVMCGIITVRTNNVRETAKWLDGLYEWWSKDWGKHNSHAQFQIRQKHASLSKPNLLTRIAKELSGVGWDKAINIGKYFGSIDELLDADIKELMEVPGIGKVLAHSIKKELNDA